MVDGGKVGWRLVGCRSFTYAMSRVQKGWKEGMFVWRDQGLVFDGLVGPKEGRGMLTVLRSESWLLELIYQFL